MLPSYQLSISLFPQVSWRNCSLEDLHLLFISNLQCNLNFLTDCQRNCFPICSYHIVSRSSEQYLLLSYFSLKYITLLTTTSFFHSLLFLVSRSPNSAAFPLSLMATTASLPLGLILVLFLKYLYSLGFVHCLLSSYYSLWVISSTL